MAATSADMSKRQQPLVCYPILEVGAESLGMSGKAIIYRPATSRDLGADILSLGSEVGRYSRQSNDQLHGNNVFRYSMVLIQHFKRL